MYWHKILVEKLYYSKKTFALFYMILVIYFSFFRYSTSLLTNKRVRPPTIQTPDRDLFNSSFVIASSRLQDGGYRSCLISPRSAWNWKHRSEKAPDADAEKQK